jgi:hypothetical protein
MDFGNNSNFDQSARSRRVARLGGNKPFRPWMVLEKPFVCTQAKTMKKQRGSKFGVFLCGGPPFFLWKPQVPDFELAVRLHLANWQDNRSNNVNRVA